MPDIPQPGLMSENMAEFDYRPGRCRKMYRVVVVRKNPSVEKGEHRLFDSIRYFFYITSDRLMPAEGIVPIANGRCNQENLSSSSRTGRGPWRCRWATW
jgi:hypothetical protein